MAIDKEKNTQLLVTLSWELKEAIEDYQFSNRLPSRTYAILQLIKLGLEYAPKYKEPTE